MKINLHMVGMVSMVSRNGIPFFKRTGSVGENGSGYAPVEDLSIPTILPKVKGSFDKI